jgi:signal transduction histidine kinase
MLINPKTKALFVSIMAALALCCTACARPGAAPAPQPLVLTDEQGKYPLGLHMELLEDPGGILTIDDVSSQEYASRFIPSQTPAPNLGYSKSVFWLKLRFQNEAKLTDQWLLEANFPNLNYIDLFLPLPGGGYQVKQSGGLRPFDTRDIPYYHVVFELPLAGQAVQTVFIRVESGSSMTLPFTLWTPGSFAANKIPVIFGIGLFFGALLIALVYFLFVFFSLREANYLYFILVIASSILFWAVYEGLADQFIWPAFSQYKLPILVVSQSLFFMSCIKFSDVFFEQKDKAPRLHRLNNILIGLWALMIALTPFFSYYFMAQVVQIVRYLTTGVLAWVGIYNWRRGEQYARLYLVSWFGYILGLISIELVRSGVLPSTYVTEKFYQAGLIWLILMWSLALADRINQLKKVTESAELNVQNSVYRLSQIIEALPFGVAVYGADQKSQLINQRAIEILENPARDSQPDLPVKHTLAQVAEYYSLWIAGTEEKYPLENLPVTRALAGEPASANDVEATLGDRRVSLEIWASPVRNAAGEIESAVAVFQDITARLQTEAELVRYQKNLEELANARTADLDRVIEHLRLHLDWLSEVTRGHRAISGVSSLMPAYEELADKILKLFGAGLVFILQWDEKKGQPEIIFDSARETGASDLSVMIDAFRKDSQLRRDLELGKIVAWSAGQDAQFPAPLAGWLLEQDLKFSIFTPVIIAESFFSVLGVAAGEPVRDMIMQQLDLLERMAFDLANLNQGAVLTDQRFALATVDERNRLARDLHDSVTQVLFTATVLAEVLPQIWRRDPEQGIQKLDKLRQLTRGALAEMRTLLLELRPSAVLAAPLSDLLVQLAEAITSRSGVQFQLSIEQVPILPENVQINVYRIAQEALNNVVKHSQAKMVFMDLHVIRLARSSSAQVRQAVELVIRDDGVGYSSGEEPASLGIGIMRERAAAIQANLSLKSKPGYGTQVSLTWYD